MKTILAIIVGYALWTAIWLAGNAGFVRAGLLQKDSSVPIESTVALLSMLGLSLVASLAAGYITKLVDQQESTRASLVLALLLLATGLAVQWSLRLQMPGWYHVLFLLLLVPATLAGARLRGNPASVRPTQPARTAR